MNIMCSRLSSGPTAEMFDSSNIQTESVQAKFLTCAELERRHITRVFNHFHGHREDTAKALGITRMTLYNKLRTYGVDVRCRYIEEKS
jgi:DNA-binding NtrC family response regulator